MRTSCGVVRYFSCAAVVAATIAGCCPWDLRGKGYGEQTESWTKNLRPPADERRMTGLDSKARDIERNLGVR